MAATTAATAAAAEAAHPGRARAPGPARRRALRGAVAVEQERRLPAIAPPPRTPAAAPGAANVRRLVERRRRPGRPHPGRVPRQPGAPAQAGAAVRRRVLPGRVLRHDAAAGGAAGAARGGAGPALRAGRDARLARRAALHRCRPGEGGGVRHAGRVLARLHGAVALLRGVDGQGSGALQRVPAQQLSGGIPLLEDVW